MQKRILFVDDDPHVLGGLRRLLRPLRHQWTMEFAEGGAQALTALDNSRYDIIVSDMRMPGMSGDQLLEIVRKRHPHMVRILLTGQCDKASMFRALQVAHFALNKPCDPEILKATLATAGSFQENPAAVSVLQEALPTP